MKKIILLFVLISFFSCDQKEDERFETKKQAIQELLTKYRVELEDLTVDLDSVSLENVDLKELEEGLMQYAPIANKMRAHNRFINKLADIDIPVENRIYDSQNQELIQEYESKLFDKLVENSNKYSIPATGVYYPYSYYEKHFELRAAIPEWYKKRDIIELASLLVDVKMQIEESGKK